MRCAYFDCFSGAAGDMIVAALIDAGCPTAELAQAVARLNLPGVAFEAHKVRRGGISATHVRVDVAPESRKKHRHLPQIVEIIGRAELSAATARRAVAVFQRLAEAEAAVHGVPPEKVHFHEVGAADAIVDVVLARFAVERLGLERIVASPVPTGHGTVTCEHGVMPVPAPATARLLAGVPLAPADVAAELTTPTGAALLTTLASEFGPNPLTRIAALGYGAGTREIPGRANVLRVLIGEAAGAAPELDADTIDVLEAQVDDATGQSLSWCLQKLLAAGALDAYLTPIIMKKGRPGQLLTVLCRMEDAAALEQLIFRETTTFGVRRLACTRNKLWRESPTVQTPFGAIRLKLGRLGQEIVRAWPEYDDCAAAAERCGVALRAVQEAALSAWQGSLTKDVARTP